jgi:hypothetical protein
MCIWPSTLSLRLPVRHLSLTLCWGRPPPPPHTHPPTHSLVICSVSPVFYVANNTDDTPRFWPYVSPFEATAGEAMCKHTAAQGTQIWGVNRSTKFRTVTPNIYGSSACSLLHVTLLVHKFLQNLYTYVAEFSDVIRILIPTRSITSEFLSSVLS